MDTPLVEKETAGDIDSPLDQAPGHRIEIRHKVFLDEGHIAALSVPTYLRFFSSRRARILKKIDAKTLTAKARIKLAYRPFAYLGSLCLCAHCRRTIRDHIREISFLVVSPNPT